MDRIAAGGLVGTDALEVASVDGVPDSLAALGVGQDAEGTELVVGFSPTSGGDALFGALALAVRRAVDGGFAGRAIAAAPDWSSASRRRLAVLRDLPFAVRALAAPGLAEGDRGVPAERIDEPVPVAPARLAGLVDRPADREIYERALAGFEGLAAKHGGAVRAVGRSVELVLLARRAALLTLEGGRVQMEALLPERVRFDLAGEGIATTLDRLEGLLRKRLNDRRIRSSDEGLRSALLPVLERAAEARRVLVWPLPGSDPEVIDLVGVGSEGAPFVAAARSRFDLVELGSILDAALVAPRALASLLPDVALAPGLPRLVVAAREFEEPALAVLSALALGHARFEVGSGRGGEWTLERHEGAEVPVERRAATREPTRRESGRARRRPKPAPAERETAGEAEDQAATAVPAPDEEVGTGDSPRFEEISLFDLDEEARSDSGDGPRRRRGRGRRRGRRARGEGASDASAATEAPDAADAIDEDATTVPRRGRRRRGRAQREEASAPDAAEDGGELSDLEDETLVSLAEPEPAEEAPEPDYEDEDDAEEADRLGDLARRERELRRRARLAKADPEPPEPPRPPRRRAAFVAQADRVSVLTAVLLARDVRLVEGFWIYPQRDLMTFFRSVATDLREETPIFLVGFTASPPARDTLQAAALYRGRLHWFDHHPWPPEDLQSLREAIGEDRVHIEPGAESSLAAVVAERTRRSRFSDKLVELATGRFSEHDYERWGRLWWHRVAELAERPGERRADVEPLLAGRPSDLAREAARAPAPPPPREVEFVSHRDFRLVHFGGFAMVVLEVPAELDIHLASRIARERYGAQLSLGYRPDEELMVIAGDEARAKRGLDLGSMTEHLATKHEWVDSLADDDHVARMLVHGLHSVPNRLDEVVAEIAMGRSIVEG